jgi:hypothetical protein
MSTYKLCKYARGQGDVSEASSDSLARNRSIGGDDRALVGQALIRAGRLIRLMRRTVICGHGAVQDLAAYARAAASAALFVCSIIGPLARTLHRQLTALMRSVIVIQPVRCKPFGPALNGEIRKPPCGAHPFQVGWGGGGFRAALFAGVANKNSAAVFQRARTCPPGSARTLHPRVAGDYAGAACACCRARSNLRLSRAPKAGQ